MLETKQRFYDIDWLRVIGMSLIFSFHNARFFNDEAWHVKNNQLSFGASVYVAVLNQFMMPLFFILSAIAIYYALKRRTGKEFMRERTNRLLVPLFFGIFTHIPLQVYIERVTHGEFTGTFWGFIPHYFDGLYGFGGNFAWMGLHLWYLLMLFLFSWMLLPLFQRLREARDFTARLADFFSRPVMIYLFFIPIMLMEFIVGLSPETIGRRDFGGWSPLTYLVIFFLGYILATDERYRPAIERIRFFSLTLSLLLLAIGYSLEMADISITSYYLAPFRGLNTWAWLLTFLGFAIHHLNFNNSFLQYANKAVLPFYILHQTVIVTVGYFIRDWQLAVLSKYLFLASVSFVIIMVLYEFVVKRINVLRFVFGMKG
ncbi:MAG: acyltransferase [Anaerolineales bacterium]